MWKLHTTQLSTELLHKAHVALPLPDSFINFNEWLLSDVLRLRTTVREAVREHGCTTLDHSQLKYTHLIPRRSPSSELSTTSSITPKVTLSEGLRICHFNANSLTGHIQIVRLFLSTRLLFHVIAVTETGLNEKVFRMKVDPQKLKKNPYFGIFIHFCSFMGSKTLSGKVYKLKQVKFLIT
ncbi:hypothetical protein TSAR_010947 [Trichomalopsis sarcophagae]|uniref:Uncharacterized protein n=1 Tax=Trichomalopsis sarcophagae TaxID=543379 RepID=A0A232FEH0_9HYME|nr:hypothetical protein TSAR_010947 [Trichomalopsis sarcophagae]